MSRHHEQIEYLVGQEHNLLELLQSSEIREILRESTLHMPLHVSIRLEDGSVVCSAGDKNLLSSLRKISMPLSLEGEEIGDILVSRDQSDAVLEGVSAILRGAISVVLNNNLKRMLTAEMHTSVVTKTYDELLAKNLDLAASEAKYRELAQSLELKVQERTAELGMVHARLLQQEKLASIGQLAAGVAHEINNPIGFINSNLATLKKYVTRLMGMIDWYQEQTSLSGPLNAAAFSKANELKLELVKSDVWALLEQSLAGTERVKKIVADLKGVSHVDEIDGEKFNLKLEIDRTLSVMKAQLPSDAKVECDLAETPPIIGSGALFCQALFNMIHNAVQAVPSGLVLKLKSWCSDRKVFFSVSDNGPGVPEDLQGRIFDPFFTTREVGAGTGMGLAVVYDIVKKSGGTVSVGTVQGGGAVFEMEFPLSLKEGV